MQLHTWSLREPLYRKAPDVQPDAEPVNLSLYVQRPLACSSLVCVPEVKVQESVVAVCVALCIQTESQITLM